MKETEIIRAVNAAGAESNWTAETELNEGEFQLSISEPGTDRTWTSAGPDLFDCFNEIRRQVEPSGIRFCVSGARIDAYPSGMSREMGGGQILYILPKPNLARKLIWIAGWRRRKKVYIFSPAPCSLVGSVDQQEEYFDKQIREWSGSAP